MNKTTVINTSGRDIVLKEGNAGVYSVLQTLVDGKSTVLCVPPNATFREYWFATNSGSSGNKVAGNKVVGNKVAVNKAILTSDDCAEYGEVRITLDGMPGWVGTLRHQRSWPWSFWPWKKHRDQGKEDEKGNQSKIEEPMGTPNSEQSQDRAGDEGA